MSYTFLGYEARTQMIDALDRYAQHRQPVGDFLRAVLENNLQSAVGHADDDNLRNLPAFVGYLYNEMPAPCWGSPEKVKAWLKTPCDTPKSSTL